MSSDHAYYNLMKEVARLCKEAERELESAQQTQ